MNIFYLDSDPALAARYHCDVHVIKMILETAQLLSTAHAVYGTRTNDMYKATHKHHPPTKWCRESVNNYQWTYDLLYHLCNEYELRYDKVHASSRLLDVLKSPPPLLNLPFEQPPQFMPEQYKDDDSVVAYRKYYISKQHTMGKPMLWKRVGEPDWFEKEISSTEHTVKPYGSTLRAFH